MSAPSEVSQSAALVTDSTPDTAVTSSQICPAVALAPRPYSSASTGTETWADPAGSTASAVVT